MINKLNDTIIAISTPTGKGAISIIRMSGKNSIFIAKKISNKKQFKKKLFLSNFYNKKKDLIDKGLIIFFKKPKSFTGENLIEFHVHCNKLILDEIINTAITLGARIAEPGEFSFRAFFYNKIDILQAESINNLINSRKIKLNKYILNSLEGIFSKEIKNIINDFTSIISVLESSIDFPDDISINEKKIIKNLLIIKKKIIKLKKESRKDFDVIKEFKIIILGYTNSGKSSLFNKLIKKKRSIITNEPGTTRDFIEEKMIINNEEYKITDTAGFNEKSESKIEKYSILKTFNQINENDIILFMSDIVKKIEKKEYIFNKIKNKFNNKKIIYIENKIDNLNIKEEIEKIGNCTQIKISVKKNLGLNLLINEISKTSKNNDSYKYIINKRHFNLLNKSIKEIKKSLKFIKNKKELVIIVEKIKISCTLLNNIIGENINNKIINKIFSNFCIGK